ncbi:MAG: type VI secretion system tip protein VgrG [Gammaproteobacteria bacterium]|nr:type VI secretion system tip protein VgrG [Gammaproteobacteria bacterium]
MAILTGNTALLSFEIKGVAASFRVVEFHGTEANSVLFAYTVQLICSSAEPHIPATDVLAQTATLTVHDEQGGTARYIHGAVVSFTQGEESERWAHYTLILRPQIWRLSLRQDCRIFQQQAVPDIIEAVLQGAGIAADHYRLALYLNYEPRDYCVQYQESDLDFIARLMREEGIFYFFEHRADQHIMVLSDAYQIHVDIPAPAQIPYHRPTGLVPEEDSVYPFTQTELIQTGQVSLSDFNFEKPDLSLQTSQQHDIDQDLEVYDYPGRYILPEPGGQYANVRLEALQVARNSARGSSDCRRFMAGHSFTLNRHSHPGLNQRYVLTSVTLSAKQPQALGEEASEEGTHYQADFQCIPAEVQFRAADDPKKPKPVVVGVQTAIVVGPPGEEIYVDEHGRVKVQFHWDRNGQNNERSSCWIRVSQLWAGEQWGAMFIPRIGQEVIVDFVNGDPDRPIITGRVYHGNNTPPYNLPAEKTKSTLKTRSSSGGTADNFNELRFEDKKGEEQLYIHAEKNQDNVVENDETTEVGHDRTENIGNDETITIGNDRTENVGNNESITIGNNRTENVSKNEDITIGENRTESVGKNESISIAENRDRSVGKNESITIGKDLTEDVGKNMTLSVGDDQKISIGKNLSIIVGKKTVIDAGDSLTLNCGGASIILKKNGKIQITGKEVNVKASGNIKLKGSNIAEN